MKRSFAAAVALAIASSAFAQGPGTGPGSGAQGGPGAGPGAAQKGPGKGGGMMRFDSRNTVGWSMMSREERNEHRNKMNSMTSLADCKAYVDDHRKQMEARAKERGRSIGPGPRTDMCQRMQSSGRVK